MIETYLMIMRIVGGISGLLGIAVMLNNMIIEQREFKTAQPLIMSIVTSAVFYTVATMPEITKIIPWDMMKWKALVGLMILNLVFFGINAGYGFKWMEKKELR